MMLKTVSTAFCIALVALAGCAEEAPPEEDEFDEVGKDLKATEKTGVIRGVVVDPAIVPIEGVTVEVASTDRSMVTGEDGVFGFQDLEPGTYFLKASKPGFLDVQQSVNVVAGVDRPEVVKVLMEADPTTRPFVQPLVFEGIITCSVSVIAFGFAACSAAGLEDRFLVDYGADVLPRTPDWSQSEMLWESTQAAGDRMTLLYSAPGESTLLDNYGEAEGTSPLLVTANQTIMEGYGVPSGYPLQIRVFNAPIEGTDIGETIGDPRDGDNCIERPVLGGCATGLGATIDQTFTVYTHAFFGFMPPEGYRFSVDGAPTPPQ